jgi:hypothetical protein
LFFSNKTAFHNDLVIGEEEPVYVPRSIMADIIYNNEDDLLKRRQRATTLVELPSGAWQKRPVVAGTNIREPVAASSVLSATAAPLAAKMGLRQRRGKGEEEHTAGHSAQPNKLIQVKVNLKEI